MPSDEEKLAAAHREPHDSPLHLGRVLPKIAATIVLRAGVFGAESPQLREMEGGMGYRNFMNGEVNELWMGRL